jgi:hypothetical protein
VDRAYASPLKERAEGTRAFGQSGAEENRNAAALNAGRIEGRAKEKEIATLLSTSEGSRRKFIADLRGQ